MIYDTAPDFSRLDYQGFVHDLAELAGKAQGVLLQVRDASGKQKVDPARAALPRPARFKGRNAPSSRRMAWLSVAQRATPEDLVLRLRDWTEDRFNPDKYQTLLCSAKSGDSGLATAINSLAWAGDRLFLEHLPTSKCWSFGLSELEVEFATSAMDRVRSVADHALTALKRVPSSTHFERLAKWFFFNRKKVEPAALPHVELVFRKVSTALMSGRDTIILCKADTRLASGRAAEAYVKPADVEMGAMVFLGDSFFKPPKKGYAGTERQIYRAATLLHELTHLFAGTDDVAGDDSYGRLNCSKLAPDQQRKNADNYGLFAFEAARSMIFESGMSLKKDMEFVLNEFKV